MNPAPGGETHGQPADSVCRLSRGGCFLIITWSGSICPAKRPVPRDLQAFPARHPAEPIIDEVQDAPGLFRQLQLEVDLQRQRNGHDILTGSQPFALMQGVSESLAGRAAVPQLDGLAV